MSLGPISILAYESYFRIFDIYDSDEQHEILAIVSSVDNYYLQVQHKKTTKKNKNQPQQGSDKSHVPPTRREEKPKRI